MGSGFKEAITIKEVIDNIYERKYLLPAIQRKFTWSSTQIEMLFDSILRDYPINSFMLWKISSDEIKSNYKFYEFLYEFREFYKDNNTNIDTKGVNDFCAIIDGQQRMTSLYIGLKGSYAYKMPRKWWRDDEECLPTRKLYLNLLSSVNQEYDNQKYYDFRFLSNKDLQHFNKDKTYYWFEVREIIGLDTIQKVNKYLNENNLSETDYAYNTLFNLFEKIHKDKLINYYLEENQESDKVLDIFIRTNSGGTPLSFSDLLMSIASANWNKIDARKEIDDLINKVYKLGKSRFIINKDFVLKTCLVLFIDNIKFQLKNFGHNNVKIFEDNWFKIKKSILATFDFIEKLGFNDRTFRAKNAAIPIIYYVYHNNLEEKIIKANYDKEDRVKITKWLNISFLKSIFGGQADRVLVNIRKILKENLGKKFPFEKIVDSFKGDPVKNYSIEEDFIDGLLTAQYESNDAFYVLSLLYPDLDYYSQSFEQDHMHPASFFNKDSNIENCMVDQTVRDFMRDKTIWNSVLNLQLLNSTLNKAKQDKSLKEWAKSKNKKNSELYLDDCISLDIENFKEFIENRKINLKKAIKQNII